MPIKEPRNSNAYEARMSVLPSMLLPVKVLYDTPNKSSPEGDTLPWFGPPHLLAVLFCTVKYCKGAPTSATNCIARPLVQSEHVKSPAPVTLFPEMTVLLLSPG